LQDKLRICRYIGQSLWNYIGSASDTQKITVTVDGEEVFAGHFPRSKSAKCAVVVDWLRVAAGGERVNLPTEELQDQVGCWRVCGRVCQSQMPIGHGHGPSVVRSRWEQRLDA
jgi:hypothetical protein